MGRLRRHLLIALLTLILFAIAAASGPASGIEDRLSIVSAWLCLALLAYTLLIGPMQVMKTGRSIDNIYIRRDIGIWSAFIGLYHFNLANKLSMNSAYIDFFVNQATMPPAVELRSQLYSWGAILGYIIAVLFLLLLSLSSDLAIRLIGMRWWKRLQRSAYFAFAFTVIHAFAFQILESRTAWLIGPVVLVTLLILASHFWSMRAFIKRKKVLAPPD